MTCGERYVAENSFYVRYAETDAMGIVHHASYIVYFEEGRSHYARSRGMDYAAFERTGHWMAVSEVNARYLVPARYAQFLTVRCWVESTRSRSMGNSQELGQTGFDGDYASRSSRPLDCAEASRTFKALYRHGLCQVRRSRSEKQALNNQTGRF